MKVIQIQQMEKIAGGNNIDAFCAGFGAVAGVYAVGVWANIWNPVGWTATGIGAIIGGSCALYAIR